MANISEDMADKYTDARRKVKFISKKEKDTGASSSAASSGDDDDSFDNTSPSIGQNSNANSTSSGGGYMRSRKSKKRAVWEVIEGYRDPNMKVQKPQNFEGVLLKRRNWPMKGWHKRYFILADGILSYGKSKGDLTKNKIHGTLNAYLSIVSYITTSRRILIDSSTQSSAFVCHLKARNQHEFDSWLENLKQHRLYYQYKYTQQYTPQPVRSNQAASQASSTAHSAESQVHQTRMAQSSANQVPNLNANGVTLPALNVIDDSNNKSTPAVDQAKPNTSTGGLKSGGDAFFLPHSHPIDDNTIDACFKQVEESLVNLSRALGSIYLSTLATSGSNTAVNAPPTVTATGGTSSISSPSAQLSQSQNNSSIDFMSLNTNSSKIHVSKSNPNLINNELQLNILSNYANSSAQTGYVQPPTLTAPTISMSSNSSGSNNGSSGYINANSAAAGGVGANSGSNVVQTLLSSSFGSSASNSNTNTMITSFNNLSTTNQYANQNAATATMNGNNASNLVNNAGAGGGGQSFNPASSPNMNSRSSGLNQSTNSLAYQNDELFKLNFYQGAKQINDQLLFIYQQLLTRRQSLHSNAQLDIENQLQRSQRSQSVMSSISLQDSQLPFYDAIEYFTSDSESDDDSDQESDGETNETNLSKSQISAIVPDYNRDFSYDSTIEEELQSQKILNRRRKLPAPAPDSSQVSIWGIMRKAIGKDLSKISLPVILNEPLSILQRLGEELEYSELLDNASNMQDPYDRMVQVAAFVISGYASSYYRNGAKDFNPLLGETYELIRPDKGWRYVAEQVSHHPPVSCCHCHSKTFIHEQLFHAKVKFWGKSMEVHPEGYSRVTLPKFNETYQWNKIVMYVYNLMGTSRRIEHYGEITIRSTNGVTCSITFPKASYSSQKNEFYGDVVFDNVVKRKIFGQWHDTFLCGTDNTAKTIWRMSAMPEDSNLYYGFTRFAIELNEFTENLKDELPQTDSRFRPDQRYLEEGHVEKAELEKQRIEDMQRKRRREMEQRGEEHQPLWFNSLPDSKVNSHDKEWVFNGQYWSKRDNPGFKNMRNVLPKLW